MTTYWCCEKNDITMFLEQSQPNQMFNYYSGYIQDHLVGRALRTEIYKLATKGLVYLVQRRSFNYMGFDYIMIKASKKPVIQLVPFSDTKLAELEKV